MVNDWFLNDNIINTLLVSNPLFLIGLTILIALLITAFYWFTGHEFHEELNYSISYPLIGDCPDRYIPRFNEIIESCRIIYALFYILLSAYFYYAFTAFSIINLLVFYLQY